MPTQIELLQEAERRGILPPAKQGLLDEARKRGLVSGQAPSRTDSTQANQQTIGGATEGNLPHSPITDQAFGFLRNNKNVRANLSAEQLQQLDGGADTAELRAAIGNARTQADSTLRAGTNEDANNAQRYATRTGRLEKVGAFAAGVQNSSTFGLGDRINSGLRAAGDVLTGRQREEGFDHMAASRQERRELRQAAPKSAIAGDIAGYLAPGTAVFKGANAAVRSAGLGRVTLQGAGTTARLGRYGQRLAPLAIAGGVDGAVYGATAASANKEADLGRDLTARERLNETGLNAAFGAAAPAVLSGVYRAGVGVRNGRQSLTPNRVASEVNQSLGVPLQTAKQQNAQVLDTVVQAGNVDRATARSFLSILEGSGLSSSDINRGLVEAVELVQRGNSGSTRPPLFAEAVATAFKDTPDVANNLQLVLRQFQSSAPRQGNAAPVIRQGLERQARSQQQHLDDTLNRELGEERIFDERKIAEQLRAHEAAEGYEQALRSIDTTSHNPNPSKLHGISQTEAIGGLREVLTKLPKRHRPLLQTIADHRGHRTIAELIEKEPQYAAHDLQSALAESDKFADRNLGTLVKDRLVRASLFTRRNGVHREARESAYLDASNTYRQRSAVIKAGDLGQGLLTKAKNGERADEILFQLRQLDPEARRMAALSIKEQLSDVFRNTNSDEVIKALPTLNQLRKAGLHDFLEDALGEGGKRITGEIQRVLDERAFIKGANPGVLGQAVDNKAAIKARQLITPNRFARKMHELSWRNALTADIGTSVAGLPTGLVTTAKAVGTALAPRARTRENLARLLTQSNATAVRPRAPRVPAPQAAVPAQTFRRDDGRFSKGVATPAGQAARPIDQGRQQQLGARQEAQGVAPPQRPVGSQGTRTREETIAARQAPPAQPTALPPVAQQAGPAIQPPSRPSKPQRPTRAERAEARVVRKVESDRATFTVEGSHGSGTWKLNKLAEEASELSERKFADATRYVDTLKTRPDLSAREQAALRRVIERDLREAFRARLDSSNYLDAKASWDKAHAAGKHWTNPVFEGSSREVDSVVEGQLRDARVSLGIETRQQRAGRFVSDNKGSLVGGAVSTPPLTFYGYKTYDGLRPKTEAERLESVNEDIARITVKWTPRDAEEILTYQSILKATVDAEVDIDGFWGNRSKAALRAYQQNNPRLIMTGRMDELTRQALLADANRLGVEVQRFGGDESVPQHAVPQPQPPAQNAFQRVQP